MSLHLFISLLKLTTLHSTKRVLHSLLFRWIHKQIHGEKHNSSFIQSFITFTSLICCCPCWVIVLSYSSPLLRIKPWWLTFVSSGLLVRGHSALLHPHHPVRHAMEILLEVSSWTKPELSWFLLLYVELWRADMKGELAVIEAVGLCCNIWNHHSRLKQDQWLPLMDDSLTAASAWWFVPQSFFLSYVNTSI